MPSFRSSPRIRSAPQSRFSLAMRSMSSIVSLANGDLRTLPDLDLRLQSSRNPSRCHRRIVSGFTRRTVSRQRRAMLASNTSRPLSCGRKRDCLTLRDATMSCCRSIMFFATSSCRERKASKARPVMNGQQAEGIGELLLRPGHDLADCGSDSGLPDEEERDRDLTYFCYDRRVLLLAHFSIILTRSATVTMKGDVNVLELGLLAPPTSRKPRRTSCVNLIRPIGECGFTWNLGSVSRAAKNRTLQPNCTPRPNLRHQARWLELDHSNLGCTFASVNSCAMCKRNEQSQVVPQLRWWPLAGP